MRSPYLCVCGDDYVTCYMGAELMQVSGQIHKDGVGISQEFYH